MTHNNAFLICITAALLFFKISSTTDILLDKAYLDAFKMAATQQTTTDVNPTPSKQCLIPTGYDINPLIETPYWTFEITSGCSTTEGTPDNCTLHISFCKPIEDPKLKGCDGSSACIRYTGANDTALILGNFTADPFNGRETNKFRADYPPGVVISNPLSKDNCTLDVSVIFECDLNAIWLIPLKDQPGKGPQPLRYEPMTKSSCHINMTVPYAGACSPAPKDTGMSTGTALLIFFGVFITIYLISGIAYNKFVEKQNGLYLIPHYQFWISIIMHSLDGFIFFWRFITCQQKRNSRLKYDPI